MNTTSDKQALDELYRDLILDHAKNPRNFQRLDNATHSAAGINPLCGDKLHVYLAMTAEDNVDSVSFEGSGCAISMASASLLTETVQDMQITQALETAKQVTQRLSQPVAPSLGAGSIDISSLRALDGVRAYPSRIKCATLAWQTLHAALCQQDTATTE